MEKEVCVRLRIPEVKADSSKSGNVDCSFWIALLLARSKGLGNEGPRMGQSSEGRYWDVVLAAKDSMVPSLVMRPIIVLRIESSCQEMEVVASI